MGGPGHNLASLTPPGRRRSRLGTGQQGRSAVPAPSAPCCPRLPLAAAPGRVWLGQSAPRSEVWKLFPPRPGRVAAKLRWCRAGGGAGGAGCRPGRRVWRGRAGGSVHAVPRTQEHPHASPLHWWHLSALALAQEETKVQLVEEPRALGVPGIGFHLKAPYPSPEMLYILPY